MIRNLRIQADFSVSTESSDLMRMKKETLYMWIVIPAGVDYKPIFSCVMGCLVICCKEGERCLESRGTVSPSPENPLFIKSTFHISQKSFT